MLITIFIQNGPINRLSFSDEKLGAKILQLDMGLKNIFASWSCLGVEKKNLALHRTLLPPNAKQTIQAMSPNLNRPVVAYSLRLPQLQVNNFQDRRYRGGEEDTPDADQVTQDQDRQQDRQRVEV